MKNDELVWLLNMANDMRAAKGDTKLEDLPDSVPSRASACLIANAFNYGCYVNPNPSHASEPGKIQFQSYGDAQTYCKVVDLSEESIRTHNYDETVYVVPLTKELNAVAYQFDLGRYSEYSAHYAE